MNGKQARALRRGVRNAMGMNTLRVDGVDLNKIGCDEYYYRDVHSTTLIMGPNNSRRIYKAVKKIFKKAAK